MELNTLEISREEAEDRLAAYRAIIDEERTAEDRAIIAGYRAAARGLPVISLSRTIQAGGYFDSGLPRLAIVRADAEVCSIRPISWPDSSLLFYDPACYRYGPDNRGALVGRGTVRVPIPDRPHVTVWNATTTVPIVPPEHRPRGRRRLGRLHVLWEVESWTPEAPRDPALLRHIRGDLWAVLAVWDLTDLERTVLSQRTV